MMETVELRCRCGAVAGRVIEAAPSRTNRMICYCDDCQAFLHQIGRADLLDAYGGTEVVQVAPASLSFERGAEQIAGLRLSPKGLFRWYAGCCNTPVGNTLRPGVPFVGIVVQAFSQPERFGPAIGAVQAKFAIGTPPAHSALGNTRMIAKALTKVLGWHLTGKAWPHPFFERTSGEPRFTVKVLSRAERDALRPLCGPRAVAPASA